MFHSTSARRTHNRAGNTIKLENITFARNNTKKNGISLKIPVSIANQAKIIIGDRIDILIDDVNGKLAIARVNDGGWKVGRTKSGSYLRTQYTGFSGGIAISPEKKTAIIPRFTITDVGIVFDFPESLIVKA